MATPWKAQNQFYRKYLYNLAQTYRSRADLRIFTEIILSLIAVSVFGIFAIKPTFVTIATLITDISEKERTITILDEKIQNLSIAQQTYQANAEKLARLDTSIPFEPLPVFYIRQVEAAAITHNVTVTSVKADNMTLKGAPIESLNGNQNVETLATFPEDATEIPFSVTVLGPYSNVQAFLKEIEQLRMPIGITTAVVGASEDGGETLSATVRGKLAYIHQQ
jgi:hypothetical protein